MKLILVSKWPHFVSQLPFSAIGYMMCTLIWPFIPFLMQLIVFFYCILLALYLSTVGKPTGIQMGNNTDNITASLESAKERIKDICDPMVRFSRLLHQTYNIISEVSELEPGQSDEESRKQTFSCHENINEWERVMHRTDLDFIEDNGSMSMMCFQ